MTVKGVLIVHGIDGKTITKEQYGSQDILKDKQGNPSVSYGDALKGAASDALKKCASLLGIALDLYANGHKYVDPEPESVTPTPEPVKTEPIKEPESVKAMTPDKINDSQKDLIQKLIKSSVFSDTEREKAISFYEKSDCTKEKADKFIKSLQSHIEIRKESEKTEKESLMKQVMGFRDTDSERFNHILAFRNNGNQQAAA